METIETSPSLYKVDSKGKIRTWKGSVKRAADGYIHYCSESGIYGGKIKESMTLMASSVLMTAEEVGKSKLKSTLDSKLKNGYYNTIEAAKDHKPTKAMLLHRWDKHFAKMRYPALQSPKLDGVCGIYVDSIEDPYIKSREDNRFEKLDFMARELSDELTTYHGKGRKLVDNHHELYAHGHTVSEIVEAIKGDNEEVLAKIRMYTHDYMPQGALDELNKLARLRIGEEFYRWGDTGRLFVPIKFLIVQNREESDLLNERFLKALFEGSVVENPMGKYVYDSRSYEKLKRKNLFSEEFKILSVSKEDNDGMELIMFTCETDKGLKFDVRPAWTHAKRAAAYKAGPGEFVGKMATVEFRSWTSYNVPFHGVLKTVRDYE